MKSNVAEMLRTTENSATEKLLEDLCKSDGTPLSRESLTKLVETAKADERTKIMTLILKEQQPMTLKYKALIKHTGSIIETSMGFAYSKCFMDIFKLIAKQGEKSEKTSEQA